MMLCVIIVSHDLDGYLLILGNIQNVFPMGQSSLLVALMFLQRSGFHYGVTMSLFFVLSPHKPLWIAAVWYIASTYRTFYKVTFYKIKALEDSFFTRNI